MVTKTTVNRLKPQKKNKKEQKKKLPTPFRIWYIRYLIINYQYQHNHTLFSVKHMANTESQKTTESKQNINLDNGNKKKKICIKDKLRNLLEEECYCI